LIHANLIWIHAKLIWIHNLTQYQLNLILQICTSIYIMQLESTILIISMDITQN
jgi:hypothetical protein